jgi:hypothetical protein
MAKISAAQFELASRAADRANRLGALVFSVAKVLFWLLTFAVSCGLIAIYKLNRDDYGSYTDWSAVWSGWAVLIGAWLMYSFALAMIALVGAVAQAKAESLDIQITQASGN